MVSKDNFRRIIKFEIIQKMSNTVSEERQQTTLEMKNVYHNLYNNLIRSAFNPNNSQLSENILVPDTDDLKHE